MATTEDILRPDSRLTQYEEEFEKLHQSQCVHDDASAAACQPIRDQYDLCQPIRDQYSITPPAPPCQPKRTKSSSSNPARDKRMTDSNQPSLVEQRSLVLNQILSSRNSLKPQSLNHVEAKPIVKPRKCVDPDLYEDVVEVRRPEVLRRLDTIKRCDLNSALKDFKIFVLEMM